MLTSLIKFGKEYYDHNRWTREKIKEYSLDNFRRMLKYAYKYSKFYGRYYKENGINYEDLDNIPIKDIPMLTKDMVRSNFYDIAAYRVNSKLIKRSIRRDGLLLKTGRYHLVHTSGSTGKPCSFLYSRRAMTIIESNFIRISVSGGKNKIGFSDLPIKALYIAPVGSGYACTALALNGLKIYHSKNKIINAQEPLHNWKKIIDGYNPNYLAGYPSCIKIAASLQEKGYIKLKPKKIITGGEPLTEENMKYFERVFGADVIDYYGCTESILLGVAASYYEGMYLLDDMTYFETDENNRLIITPFYNKEFPLIRYKLNDMVEDFCNGKYGNLPYTHIKRVVGRSEEIMWFKNEYGNMDFLHPLFLDDIDVQGIKEYQFIQESNEYFKIRCVKMSDSSAKLNIELKCQIEQFLIKKHMRNVKYTIEFAQNLERNKITGKTKLVIKK